MSFFIEISKEKVEKYLSETGYGGISLTVFDSIDSTNTALKKQAEAGAPHGAVIVARTQTAGRGRMGRSFHSPEGTGLYISLLIRPSISSDEVLLITPLTAVAVCRALEEARSAKTEIKWVNDVYINGKKAAGILVEGSVSASGKVDYAIVGIGINLFPPKCGFPEDIRSSACAVFDHDTDIIDVNRLISDLIRHFMKLYNDLPSKGFMTEYRERSYLIGRSVTVSKGENQYTGTVYDVDDSARLVVECSDGTKRTFDSGEARAKSLQI